jgi:hypothetical protein
MWTVFITASSPCKRTNAEFWISDQICTTTDKNNLVINDWFVEVAL